MKKTGTTVIPSVKPKKTTVKSSVKTKKPRIVKGGLNPKQEYFCELFASNREFFGNGVQSYIESYQPDQTKKGWYNVARSRASELLTSPNILNRINELLDLGPLNNEFVDKQLGFVITQNADFPSKVAAIREFNKLKKRITEKLDLTSGGKPFQVVEKVFPPIAHATKPS